MELKEIMRECHKTAIGKGWWEEGDRNFGEIITLIHCELSEAFEEYRNGHSFDEIYYHISKPEGIAVELADVLIRLFDVCEKYKIPIEKALEEKMSFNKNRPYRHGGKKA